jgi:isochorismate synthase
VRRTRPGKPILVSVSEQVTWTDDPAAAILGSRLAGEPWFCFEQPARGASVVAGIGVAASVGGAPQHDRFDAAQAQWLQMSERALGDTPAGPPGSGMVAIGGFAFAPNGGGSPGWDGFGAGSSLQVPQVSLAARDGEVWLTVTANVEPGADPDQLVTEAERVLAKLNPHAIPLLDPSPIGRFIVHSPMAPSHYEEAVARAVERINAGELEKVVLAREVTVEAPDAHDPAAIFGALRGNFPECFVYAVGRGARTFIGATPELLVRREGERASTVALAGTIRRSGDAAMDEHLGRELLSSGKNLRENSIVAKRIAATLKPFSVWVTVAPEPLLIKVANLQHLALPIRAQLKGGSGALELAGALHPTPAVGGEPSAVAQKLIPALEGFDRGWYAGTVGWTDTAGDGEFCVALRCALLHGNHATCFAGAGIVADSDPSAELAETEVKLQAMLPVLSG